MEDTGTQDINLTLSCGATARKHLCPSHLAVSGVIRYVPVQPFTNCNQSDSMGKHAIRLDKMDWRNTFQGPLIRTDICLSPCTLNL